MITWRKQSVRKTPDLKSEMSVAKKVNQAECISEVRTERQTQNRLMEGDACR